MQLKYSGQEQIAAKIDDVWTFLASPEAVVSCLPDVVSSEVIDATHIDAVVRVSIGAIGGNLSFKIALEPNRGNNSVVVKLRGDGINSSVDLAATAALLSRSDGITTLDWAGVATIFGMLASIGGRVMDSQGERIFSHVFARIREHFVKQ